jgi:hypothetical protein
LVLLSPSEQLEQGHLVPILGVLCTVPILGPNLKSRQVWVCLLGESKLGSIVGILALLSNSVHGLKMRQPEGQRELLDGYLHKHQTNAYNSRVCRFIFVKNLAMYNGIEGIGLFVPLL